MRRLPQIGIAALALAALPALGRAQLDVALHAAFAAERADEPTGLAWLRHQFCARRPEWPTGGDPAAPFALHYRGGRLSFAPALRVPTDAVVAGECTLAGGAILFACNAAGRERWQVELDALPPALARLVTALDIAVDAPPRAIDVPALVGNLAGGAADGDERAQWLALGALQCGEVTVAARRAGGRIAVHGASAGGLMLPAVLLWLALAADGSDAPDTDLDGWRLRAFGGRDGDRAEAARQVQRAGAEALPVLRALLHADEPSRLSAIDALVRLRAAGELPAIVTAGDASMPLAVAMAAVAVRELWPQACADTRTATQQALRGNRAVAQQLAPAAGPDPRYRLLAALAMAFVGLFTLWLRERTR